MRLGYLIPTSTAGNAISIEYTGSDPFRVRQDGQARVHREG